MKQNNNNNKKIFFLRWLCLDILSRDRKATLQQEKSLPQCDSVMLCCWNQHALGARRHLKLISVSASSISTFIYWWSLWDRVVRLAKIVWWYNLSSLEPQSLMHSDRINWGEQLDRGTQARIRQLRLLQTLLLYSCSTLFT